MKEVFFLNSSYDRIAYLLDEAEMMARLGHEVTVITCNHNVRRCNSNMTCNKVQCIFCERYTKKLLAKCSSNINVICLTAFSYPNIQDSIERLTFEYNNIEDIKKIKYHDAYVGFGSLSLYISLTRNLNPLMDAEFRSYFDKLLKDTCLMAALQEEAIKRIKPDRISLFNGRFPEVRGALDYALKHNIEIKSCEYTMVYPGRYLKRYFNNSLPHSMSKNVEMINSLWSDKSISELDKDSLGRWFYDSKLNHKYYGDKDYVGGQDKELLPKEWSDKKTNYVIYNSSQDEYVAIGDEYDNGRLFTSEYEGIRHIAELLRDRTDIHIYLRIHPNLKVVKYRYHTDLLKLGDEYPNLTVIPADSKVSSYTLLLKSDRIIVFGSTIGAEASFAGKPVINLCKWVYSGFNITYEPKVVEELDELLLRTNLAPKPQADAVKFGFYYMNPYGSSYTFYNYNQVRFSFLGRNLVAYHHAKLLGSSRLYAIFQFCVSGFFHRAELPLKENANI